MSQEEMPSLREHLHRDEPHRLRNFMIGGAAVGFVFTEAMIGATVLEEGHTALTANSEALLTVGTVAGGAVIGGLTDLFVRFTGK